MMFSATMDRRQLVGRSVCALAIAGLVCAFALTGCDTYEPEAMVGSAGDVCLFAGGDNPDKADQQAPMSAGGTEKANLALNGIWRGDSVEKGSWERHRINTVAGYTYIVELCTRYAGGKTDPDLYIGRDEDPYNNFWKKSNQFDPRPDVIVFRAKKTGRMYVAVYGFDNEGDCVVSYSIRVRRRLNPARG